MFPDDTHLSALRKRSRAAFVTAAAAVVLLVQLYGSHWLRRFHTRGQVAQRAIFRRRAAYRLCGNSTRWVALWARFCPMKEDVLVNGYMYSGYSYEIGETWLPPLKQAIVDPKGHLRLGYWKGNDSLRGTFANIDLSKCRKVYPFSCSFNRS